jgi:hypothetical protein
MAKKKKTTKKKTKKKVSRQPRRRTKDIDISSIETELNLNPIGDNPSSSADVAQQWEALNADIEARLEALEDDDPREYIKRVAKEALKDAFRFLAHLRSELESGSRSAMMFQSASHTITSISQTIEKLNGVLLGAEKNDFYDKKIQIEMARVKLEAEKVKVARLKAQNPNQIPGTIRADNVLIMTREEALEKAKQEMIEVDVDDEIKQLEGEILSGSTTTVCISGS